jgi:hypothetical protein
MSTSAETPPTLSTPELVRLVTTVFAPRASDHALAVLVDVPPSEQAGHPAWSARRAIAADWCRRLTGARTELGLDRVSLVAYPAVERNNADLPARGAVADPEHSRPGSEALAAADPLEPLLAEHDILVALTERSATAPLKLLARRHGFRAATMPGFSVAMVPALRLDYEAVSRRCDALKARLDRAVAARLRLVAAGTTHELTLDPRHRRAIASGGLIREPGTAGNLPSGETYIVPYEGERADDPSASAGVLPLELGGELMLLRIAANRVVEVEGSGPRAAAERDEFRREPAYANVAELGLGVLAREGIAPIGELLLDEKLGLHVAFGRSDHFGGAVGPSDFTAPERVVHIDRVYIRQTQPQVSVAAVDLDPGGGAPLEPLMRDFEYVGAA